MQKLSFTFFIFLILNNCGGFEFVHKTNINDFHIKNNTLIKVDGDNASQIHVLLRDAIGDNKDDYPKYKLLVSSIKTESAEVIKKDATASKFNIQYSMKYNLYNLHKDCKIFDKKITTNNTYNAESAGYSFGTDLSQKESNIQNINKNIEKFISFLNLLPTADICD